MRKIIFATFLLIPFLALAQDSGTKKQAYYFYGEQCPHCVKVDEYFKANGIYEKYQITKLEATANPFNGKLFLEFGKAFGASGWGGVPTVIFGDKYLVGDAPIIENFVSKIEATENTDDLPDPEKIVKTSKETDEKNSSVQDSQKAGDAAASGENQEGDKKNYFAVVLFALVFLGGGALVYLNRKKS